MNLCIVSFQAVLLAVLIVQYHNIYKVEAEQLPRHPHEYWFNSVEKKIEIVQNDANPETEVVMEKKGIPKRKKRITKKHKKKIGSKYGKHGHLSYEVHEHIPHEKHVLQEHILHDQQEHLPHEQRLDASVQQDKVDIVQKVLRKKHKKRGKERMNQRKFVKMDQKESNSSESDEVKRRKPVDIIVHIKMND